MFLPLMTLLTGDLHAAETTGFVSLEWRGYAMADHLSHGAGFSAGVSLFDDVLRIGIAGTQRPGPINTATFELDVEPDYKGQSTLQLRSDGGTMGVVVAPGLPLRGGKWQLSAPILIGYGGYGFYLVDEDRETPDGRKPSAWEDELLNGRDSAFGLAIDGGIQLAFGAERMVRPTVSLRYHAILGYDATYTGSYAGPALSVGVEVLPGRRGR